MMWKTNFPTLLLHSYHTFDGQPWLDTYMWNLTCLTSTQCCTGCYEVCFQKKKRTCLFLFKKIIDLCAKTQIQIFFLPLHHTNPTITIQKSYNEIPANHWANHLANRLANHIQYIWMLNSYHVNYLQMKGYILVKELSLSWFSCPFVSSVPK